MSPRIATRKIERHTLVRRGITCRVVHTRGYFDYSDHIEIFVVSPKGAPLPITETGYRSEFRTADEIAVAGGAVALITVLLETEAASKRWRMLEIKRAQLDLFDD